MKKSIVLLLMSMICLAAFSQSYRKVENRAFQRGEKLTYRLAFNSAITGSITAGKAILEVLPDNKPFNNRNTYHVVGQGTTTGLIEMFFKVNDKFESYFDEEALIPWLFIRNTHENNYRKNDRVHFRHSERTAVSLTKVMKVPVNVQDMVSALYYARTLDVSGLKTGDYIQIPFFLDDSVYNSRVIFNGRETVKTKMGKFKCISFRPMVATGYAFDDPYPITIYVTDDENHLPVLINVEQAVGRTRVELTSISGLLNPVKALAVQ